MLRYQRAGSHVVHFMVVGENGDMNSLCAVWFLSGEIKHPELLDITRSIDAERDRPCRICCKNFMKLAERMQLWLNVHDGFQARRLTQ